MKKRFISIALLLAGSLAAANVRAQVNNTLRVEKKLIERSGDYLLVDLTLNLSDLDIKSNRAVTFTPVIQRGDSLTRLPPLIVNGRNRQILYERTGSSPSAARTAPSSASTTASACPTHAGWASRRWRW